MQLPLTLYKSAWVKKGAFWWSVTAVSWNSSHSQIPVEQRPGVLMKRGLESRQPRLCFSGCQLCFMADWLFFFLTVENAVVCSCTVLYFSASISKDLLSDCKCKFPINSSQGGGHVVHHGCFCGRWGGRTSQDSGQLGRQHHMSPVLGS